MHFQDQQLQYVDYRLIQWAEWTRLNGTVGRGYPTAAIEWRILHEGAITTFVSGPERLETNVAAEEIEALMAILAKYNPKAWHVICVNYLHKGDAKAKQKAVKMGESNYRLYLLSGLNWLAGSLIQRKSLL